MSTGTAVNEETVTNNISCKRNSFLTDVFQLFFYFVVCFSFPSPLSTFPQPARVLMGLKSRRRPFQKKSYLIRSDSTACFIFLLLSNSLTLIKCSEKSAKKNREKHFSSKRSFNGEEEGKKAFFFFNVSPSLSFFLPNCEACLFIRSKKRRILSNFFPSLLLYYMKKLFASQGCHFTRWLLTFERDWYNLIIRCTFEARTSVREASTKMGIYWGWISGVRDFETWRYFRYAGYEWCYSHSSLVIREYTELYRKMTNADGMFSWWTSELKYCLIFFTGFFL